MTVRPETCLHGHLTWELHTEGHLIAFPLGTASMGWQLADGHFLKERRPSREGGTYLDGHFL